jgi:hypothetical protein
MKLDADEQALMDEIEYLHLVPKPSSASQYTFGQGDPPASAQEAMDAFVNPNKQSAPVNLSRMKRLTMVKMKRLSDDEDMGETGTQEEQPSKGYTSIDEEKADLLNKLARLEKKGFAVNKRLTAYSNM